MSLCENLFYVIGIGELSQIPPVRPTKTGGFSFFACFFLVESGANSDERLALPKGAGSGVVKLVVLFDYARILAEFWRFLSTKLPKLLRAISSSFLLYP